MLITLLLFALVCLMGMRITPQLQEDFLSREHTNAYKGVFVILIFLQHAVQYLTLGDGLLDKSYDIAMGLLGQNIVIAFLLYSGYGVAEAIKTRGSAYTKRLPSRALKIWLHFLLALALYVLLNLLLLHQPYTMGEYALSLVALHSIGNSTWFVFAIIVCYLLTWASFSLCKKRPYLALGMLTALIFAYIFAIRAYKGEQEHAWFDTVLCYPLGMLISFGSEKVRAVLRSGWKTAGILLVSASWVVIRFFIEANLEIYLGQSLLFAVFVLTLSSRVHLGNRVLAWLGKHTFSVYILQRLPMLALLHFGIAEHRWLFLLLSLAVTCLLAELFDRGTEKLDRLLRL